MLSAQIRDRINLLSKFTFGRGWNALQLLFSFYLSKQLKRPVLIALPAAVSMEPTTSCNLRCPECPSGLRSFTRPTGMLDMGLFKSTIDQVSARAFYLTLYFQGEPFLNPHFLEMVKYAESKGLYVATSTNAHYLSDSMAQKTVEAKLDRLVISIDGTTQDTYEQYRIGGQLQKVLEGTKNIVRWKRKMKSSKPYLIFQYLVVKPNEHQVGEAERLAKELGVDEIVFKTAQIYDHSQGSPLLPDNPKYSRYKLNADGTYSIKNKLMNQCWRMWQSCVLTWDGRVVPCCFDKDASHVLGSVLSNPFKEIWYSDAYDQFRQSILWSRSEIEICKNCTEGTKVFSE